jgi:hypothetical protein
VKSAFGMSTHSEYGFATCYVLWWRSLKYLVKCHLSETILIKLLSCVEQLSFTASTQTTFAVLDNSLCSLSKRKTLFQKDRLSCQVVIDVYPNLHWMTDWWHCSYVSLDLTTDSSNIIDTRRLTWNLVWTASYHDVPTWRLCRLARLEQHWSL